MPKTLHISMTVALNCHTGEGPTASNSHELSIATCAALGLACVSGLTAVTSQTINLCGLASASQ